MYQRVSCMYHHVSEHESMTFGGRWGMLIHADTRWYIPVTQNRWYMLIHADTSWDMNLKYSETRYQKLPHSWRRHVSGGFQWCRCLRELVLETWIWNPVDGVVFGTSNHVSRCISMYHCESVIKQHDVSAHITLNHCESLMNRHVSWYITILVLRRRPHRRCLSACNAGVSVSLHLFFH